MWAKCALTVCLLVVTLLPEARSSLTPLVAANNDFGVRLYIRIADVLDDQNVFLSPFSISTAMAMTSAGARGNTLVEMNKALRFQDHGVSDISGGFHTLLEKISSSNNDNCTLVLANRLFPDNKFRMRSVFVKLATEKYTAVPKSLDFAGAADEARRYINKWAADATEQKIKDLLSANDITPATALVLANAIYFKASWRTPFDKSKSTTRPFHVSADFSANITMMQISGKFRFFLDSKLKCRFVELPYAGTNLAMILVVPEDNDGLLALESNLTSSSLGEAIVEMKEVTVKVSMPKFNITQRVDLVQTLDNMGIHDLFKPGSADLSDLTEDSKGLAVSGVVHKAYISVDEEGTEAAASTAVVVNRMGRLAVVIADRPFMFLIRDKETGSILFIGRLLQPPKDDETTDNSPSIAGHAAPVSVVAYIVSLAMLLFVGHAF